MKLEEAINVAKKVLEKTQGVNYFIMKSNDGDYGIAWSCDEREYAEELGWKFVIEICWNIRKLDNNKVI